MASAWNVADILRPSPKKSSRKIRTFSDSEPSGVYQLPSQYANERVQESDGSFFENFTALAWRHENRRLRAAHEAAKNERKDPPAENQIIPLARPVRLAWKEYELLYIEVLYTIKHKIGTTSAGHSGYIQDLYQYAQESFNIQPEEHARLLGKAAKEKPPIVILTVTVLDAKDLEAKDADGFSDPYCMLGIIPGGRRGSLSPQDDDSDEEPKTPKEKKGIRKLSTTLKFKPKKEKMKIPARYIQATSVKPNTLNPVWNEKFRFDLDDIKTDCLHLDIWDHDDEVSVFDAASKLNEVKGVKGLNRFFKQMAQSARSSSGNVDDFLGSVNVPLQEIHSTGDEVWFDLEARSSKSKVEGSIRLKLKLATREDRGIPEEDNWTDVKQHEDLMKIFIKHEIRTFQEKPYKWHGELPRVAQTILHQHAIQGDITPIQQTMCRWNAYSQKLMEQPFGYEYILKLLKELDDAWMPGTLSRDEEGNGWMLKDMEESLAKSFNAFIDFCLNLLAKQRDVFPPTVKAAHHRLEYMLRCLAFIYEMKVFRKCCPFQKELRSEIVTTIKKSTFDWYKSVYDSSSESHERAERDGLLLSSMVQLVSSLNADLHNAQDYYQNLFERIVKVDYLGVTYKQVEKLLAEDVNTAMAEELGCDMGKELMSDIQVQSTTFVDQRYNNVVQQDDDLIGAPKIGAVMFELYLSLQEFCRWRHHLPSGERKSINISRYYEWFHPGMSEWLIAAQIRLNKRVQKAVELDKGSKINDSLKYSTSAVDVCCAFNQIVEFWSKLSWPDPEGAYTFALKLTTDMCQAAMLYADLIHQKLKAAGYYDEVGQFDVTEQLCITINDIEHVRRGLKPLPDALKFAEIEAALHRTEDEKFRQPKALRNVIKTADEDMVKKIKQVVDKVADRMRPDIKKDVFHLCWSPESMPADEAIEDLIEYLDSNLLTMNRNLLKSNFLRIMDSIWVESLEEFLDVLNSEEEKSNAFCERLYEALMILEDFFHANEKGLPKETIRNHLYKNLCGQLLMLKAATSKLISTYYLDRYEEQTMFENHPSRFGSLNVRAYYNRDADILCVEVLNGKDLIPLDTNGLSDPFVVVELVPRHVFPKQAVHRTQVIKKTLNPVFDESFEFTVDLKQCQQRGAMILFTVMDYDLISQNDFAGEGFLPLGEIPGVSQQDLTGYDALREISLPLTQPSLEKKSVPLTVLESRPNDRQACDFVRKRKQVLSQVTEFPF